MPAPCKVFTIYAREDAQYLDELRGHLAPLERAGRIRVWSDREINPGVDWEREIIENLERADIVLILVSAAYFNSAYIHDVEIKHALARHEKGEARVLPVILRPCAFGDDPVISRLQALPTDAKPVTSRTHWPDRDDAWLDVVAGLKRTLDDLRETEKQREQESREAAENERRAAEQKRAAAERQRQAERAERERQEREQFEAAQRARREQERRARDAEAERRREAEERRKTEERVRKQAETPPLPLGRYAAYGGGALLLLLAVWLFPKILKSNITAPEMILIKGGSFDMGDNFGDGSDQEKPVHKVTLSDFYLGKMEVTFDEYDAYCEATGKTKPSDEGWGRAKRPVINVSWLDVVAYCNWLSEQHHLSKVYTINGNQVAADWKAGGYRLPTEAEWEYAARSGGKKEKWAGTSAESELYRYANFCDKECGFVHRNSRQNDDYPYTAPVTSFQPNAAGLYDMSGNVGEWCWDWYGQYPSTLQDNPVGGDSGLVRVYRGGSWNNSSIDARCACRRDWYPGNGESYLGFRLARAVKF